jgi:hypothetical protein
MVFTTAADDELQSSVAGARLNDADLSSLHGALAGTESSAEILARFSARTADRLVDLVRDAFVSGMQWAFRLVALMALGGLLVSVLRVGGSLARTRRVREPEPAPSGTAS